MPALQVALATLAVLATAQASAFRPLRPLHQDSPDVGASQCQLIAHRGLACERHNVTTEDGYILAVFRIPRPGARVAVLQHGLLSSSYSYTNNLRNESLAYILHGAGHSRRRPLSPSHAPPADAGFDVWLPNSRGNTFSRAHVVLDPSMPAFWQFSWDEMAAYDVPAVVDFVRNATGSPTVAYVGHSQGTTMAFGALATQARMRAVIRPYVALAPVAYVHQSPSKLLHALADLDVDRWLQLLGVKDFLPSTAFMKRLGLHCEATPAACADALSWIMGKSGQLNVTRIAVYLTEEPAGTSVQNMAHWAQVRTALARRPPRSHSDPLPPTPRRLSAWPPSSTTTTAASPPTSARISSVTVSEPRPPTLSPAFAGCPPSCSTAGATHSRTRPT